MDNVFSWEQLVLGHNRLALNQPFSGSVGPGCFYGVLGGNGCGKSTLLKTWLGLHQPFAGQVFAPWLPLGVFSEGKCGYVPQSHTVNPYCSISVHDFVAQGLGPRLHVHQQGLCTVLPLLEQWQLSQFSNTPFHHLSGGQKSRALLARAFIAKPTCLFLDEPLANLDSCCQWQLMTTLAEWAQQGCAVVIVDHHLDPFLSFLNGTFVFSKKHDEDKSQVLFRLS